MKRYPLFSIREHLSLGAPTLNPIFRVLTWSFNVAWLYRACTDLVTLTLGPPLLKGCAPQALKVLSNGRYPHHDADGNPLRRESAKKAGKLIDAGGCGHASAIADHAD